MRTSMSTGEPSDAFERRLHQIRGGPPPRAPNARTLAAYAARSACPLATLGFSAGVDFDRLLDGTSYKMPFGLSPFAIARGLKFERALRADDYALTRSLLAELPGF